LVHLFLHRGEFNPPVKIRETFPDLYYTPPDEAAIRETMGGIMDTLKALNVVCFCLQYRDHYPGTLDAEIGRQLLHVNQPLQGRRLELPALYKALECLEYQIETQHLVKLRDLNAEEVAALGFLRAMPPAIAAHLIQVSTAYQNAPWAI
jgi:hypothetical protein